MAHYTDWLPTTRDGQLTAAKNWVTILNANGAAWNIPAAETAELASLADAADVALIAAKNETTRTPVATARCKTAFEALTAKIRDIKKRYFYTPPLTDADMVSLGLKPRDATQTPSGTPTAQATAKTFLVGRHELGIRIVYVTGSSSALRTRVTASGTALLGRGRHRPRTRKSYGSRFTR